MTRRTFLGIGATAALSATPQQQQAIPTSPCQVGTHGTSAIFYDRNGLIVQSDCDGGDTAQREGWYWFGVSIRDQISQPWTFPRSLSFGDVMSRLEIDHTGTFWRNPVKWNDPKDFTRDQTIPIVAAMGIRSDNDRLERFYRELRRRNWFAQRAGDEMTTPIYRNFILRARNEDPSQLTDAASLYAAAAARLLSARGNLDDVGDDLNLIVIFLMATVRKPNRGADRAREYYSKNRPDNYGMFLGSYREKYGVDWNARISSVDMRKRMDAGITGGWKPDCPRVLGALRWYFRAESGGSPGLAELYEPIIRKWFQ